MDSVSTAGVSSVLPGCHDHEDYTKSTLVNNYRPRKIPLNGSHRVNSEPRIAKL